MPRWQKVYAPCSVLERGGCPRHQKSQGCQGAPGSCHYLPRSRGAARAGNARAAPPLPSAASPPADLPLHEWAVPLSPGQPRESVGGDIRPVRERALEAREAIGLTGDW